MLLCVQTEISFPPQQTIELELDAVRPHPEGGLIVVGQMLFSGLCETYFRLGHFG